MIKISNITLNTEQYKSSISNVALYGSKNNYWCRETKVKRSKTNNN